MKGCNPSWNINHSGSQIRQSAKLFLQSSGLGPPHSLAHWLVCTPPLVWVGGAHSLAREGVGEYQFRRGDIHCGTLYILYEYLYFVLWIHNNGLATMPTYAQI